MCTPTEDVHTECAHEDVESAGGFWVCRNCGLCLERVYVDTTCKLQRSLEENRTFRQSVEVWGDFPLGSYIGLALEKRKMNRVRELDFRLKLHGRHSEYSIVREIKRLCAMLDVRGSFRRRAIYLGNRVVEGFHATGVRLPSFK